MQRGEFALADQGNDKTARADGITDDMSYDEIVRRLNWRWLKFTIYIVFVGFWGLLIYRLLD